MRHIILDTETTGLKPEEGHRIIEVGCLELIDRKLTGEQFHQYLNPDREVEAGAIAVHGIKNDFLRDKPRFAEIAHELMAFIDGAELIIHNAPFDVGFINHELTLTGGSWQPVTHYCSVLDTLKLARQLHAGQRNSLDALCKRYGVDNTKREYHGALLDAFLLTQVYLAMTGGQGSFFDALHDDAARAGSLASERVTDVIEANALCLLKADEASLREHEKYLEDLKRNGQCLWLDH
ncbi:MAG: DNA polymerase III subunit epsilon [Gammaproteobacteria bacterium RIFCSPHIGHO2_12_FULL_45_12]|nr:MAG: DNA polymerase III subunit epsilon [Gammaproteobacteria bacterium RIFCSPHIGHO2_12_FULL_45_12]